MSAPEATYSDDKQIWRRIMSEFLPENEDLLSALEEELSKYAETVE